MCLLTWTSLGTCTVRPVYWRLQPLDSPKASCCQTIDPFAMQGPAFLSLGGTLTLEIKPTFLICTSVFCANKNPCFAFSFTCSFSACVASSTPCSSSHPKGSKAGTCCLVGSARHRVPGETPATHCVMTSVCRVQKRQPTETGSGVIGTTDGADEHREETEQVCVFFGEAAREGQVCPQPRELSTNRAL